MAICTKTGLIINDDDVAEYEAPSELIVPKGKARKQDGTLIDLPKKEV